MAWATANSACAQNGGRLPSIEQARTLSRAWYSKAFDWNPFGFVASYYWSSTPVPSSPSTLAYSQNMSSGHLDGYSQTFGFYVRCVR